MTLLDLKDAIDHEVKLLGEKEAGEVDVVIGHGIDTPLAIVTSKNHSGFILSPTGSYRYFHLIPKRKWPLSKSA